MRLRLAPGIACLGLVIAGCGALSDREPVVITATPNAAQLDSALPALAADPGPYENVTALLDGVCTEFLLSAAGETFIWDTLEALSAFYDRVDSAEVCPAPAARGSFDFTGRVLAGAIAAATGCDAAFRAGALAPDAAGAQVFPLELVVEPGCDYELVEPLLVAVPRPPAGTTLRVEVRGF